MIPATGRMLISDSYASECPFKFAFAAAPNGTNTVLTSSDPGLPNADWTVLGTATEFAPGLFLFIDQQTTGTGPRFYRIRSP